jgi:hypothetical protein
MLTDMHSAVLELLKDGLSLSTKRTHSRTTAMIGSKRVPVAIVTDLERANMIRCYQVDNSGEKHGTTRYFEFVKDYPDPQFETESSRKKPAPRISKEDARQRIISAWEEWWATRRLMGKAATDNDAHFFLKELRSKQPALFAFQGRQNAYEVAFAWLIDAGILSTEKIGL